MCPVFRLPPTRRSASCSGRPHDSLIGLTDYDVVPPQQAAVFQEVDRKVLASNAPHESEEMLTSADGAEFWLFTRKSAVTVRSGERYVVGVISDITERKRMEKDLVAAKLRRKTPTAPSRCSSPT